MAAPTLASFQPSLLASGPAGHDPAFATARRTALDGGAWVEHVPGWLAGADGLFTELVETVPWRGREVVMYDRLLPEPRLTAWWAGPGGDHPLAAAPARLRALLPVLRARYGLGFDAIGLNLYRDGRDSVAWHGDRFEQGRPVTVVVVLSLGSPRRFLLRPRGGGPSRRYLLHSGDLLVMGGTCQHTWEHTIPKVARAGPRMSATFRHRLPPGRPAEPATPRGRARREAERLDD